MEPPGIRKREGAYIIHWPQVTIGQGDVETKIEFQGEYPQELRLRITKGVLSRKKVTHESSSTACHCLRSGRGRSAADLGAATPTELPHCALDPHRDSGWKRSF